MQRDGPFTLTNIVMLRRVCQEWEDVLNEGDHRKLARGRVRGEIAYRHAAQCSLPCLPCWQRRRRRRPVSHCRTLRRRRRRDLHHDCWLAPLAKASRMGAGEPFLRDALCSGKAPLSRGVSHGPGYSPFRAVRATPFGG